MKENLTFLSTIFFIIFILISSSAEPNTLEKLDQRIFDAIYDKKNSGSTRHTLMENITCMPSVAYTEKM